MSSPKTTNRPTALICLLTLLGAGLCLASSGWDGSYLSRYMPVSMPWLGYVLNTTMDITTQALTYAWGKLRQGDKRSKPYRLAALLIPVEIASVLASWFLTWRQLLIVMPSVEGGNTWWVALIVASFTPLLLAGIGLALSLLTGKWEAKETTKGDTVEVAQKPVEIARQPVFAQEVAFTNRQLTQIERVVAVYAANETAVLQDLQIDGLIGSATTASRARQRAIEGGYLVQTMRGFAPNGHEATII